MMLKKDVDFVPQSPQKMQGFRKMDMSGNVSSSAASSPSPGGDVSVGTVAGMGGRRTRTHSRTRSAFALGISSTRTSSRTSSRERGHARARSVGRRDSEMASGMLEGDDVSNLGIGIIGGKVAGAIPLVKEVDIGGTRMQARARTTEEKKELLGTMLGNVDALVEGVRKAGIWGLG